MLITKLTNKTFICGTSLVTMPKITIIKTLINIIGEESINIVAKADLKKKK